MSILTRLDLITNADFINSWTRSFYNFTNSTVSDTVVSLLSSAVADISGPGHGESCEEWLERKDYAVHSRDFSKQHVLVAGPQEDWKLCSVGCKFGFYKNADAAFGLYKENGQLAAGILQSMESAHYFSRNE